MQDAPLMQVLESGKDLPKVLAHLWLQQGVRAFRCGPGTAEADLSSSSALPDPPFVCSPRKNKAPTLGLKVPTSSPTSTIPHLSAAELQENVYVVSILKVVRNARCGGAAGHTVQLHLV